MSKAVVPGTEGYERGVSHFIQSCQNLDFHVVCKDIFAFLPEEKSDVLDIGSGAGQNAAKLAELGFNVTAVEPMNEFLSAAKRAYKSTAINWLDGSLPNLACLDSRAGQFDFVLIEGVWHHLNEMERRQSVARISSIIKKQGKCAISLRNGPAGLGTRVYQTNCEHTIQLFESFSFKCLFSIQNQDSVLPSKANVKWSRIVFQKQ